jgi:hydrogenase nickel incorporation protein HypA/HybF
MHEISLVRSVFHTLEAEFSMEDLQRLQAIDLKIGLLSNVEPLLLQNAFEAVTTAEEKYLSVQLNVTLVPIEIFCEACDTYTTIENYRFACASCQQPNNNVVKGTELLIHQVHFEN